MTPNPLFSSGSSSSSTTQPSLLLLILLLLLHPLRRRNGTTKTVEKAYKQRDGNIGELVLKLQRIPDEEVRKHAPCTQSISSGFQARF
jgi:hypothetical protein